MAVAVAPRAASVLPEPGAASAALAKVPRVLLLVEPRPHLRTASTLGRSAMTFSASSALRVVVKACREASAHPADAVAVLRQSAADPVALPVDSVAVDLASLVDLPLVLADLVPVASAEAVERPRP